MRSQRSALRMLRVAATATLLALLLLCPAPTRAQDNYDETKVGTYELPDPFTASNGQRITTAEMWRSQRRPEILGLFASQVFGRIPANAPVAKVESVKVERDALGGTAVRKQVAISFSRDGKPGPTMHLLLYIPAKRNGPAPAFLGLNFGGNQTVHSDPGIELATIWMRDPAVPRNGTPNELTPYKSAIAPESSRGRSSSQWQVEKILAAGFALATIYYGDIEPDFAGGLPHSIRALSLPPGKSQPAADEWGALAAWGFGLSRAMDYLATDADIDARHVALIGHSRLGKAALWAGARDERFALVISNNSGEGGAAIARRVYGERTARLNSNFPHWYCGNFKKYSDHEDQLPVDAHMLLGLIAPRPVYVASAVEDRHSDPRGEFLAAVAAGPIYQLLGKRGLGTAEMPALQQPIQHDIAYHIRAGKHDVTAYDWEQYIAFAKQQFRPH